MSLGITGTVTGPLPGKCKNPAAPMSIVKRNHHGLEVDHSPRRTAESRAIVHAIWTLAASIQVSRKNLFHQQAWLSSMHYNSFGRLSLPLVIENQLTDVVISRGADFQYTYSQATDQSSSIITSPSQQKRSPVLISSHPPSTEPPNPTESCPLTGTQPSKASIPNLNAISTIPPPSDVLDDGPESPAALCPTRKLSNDKAKAELFNALRATPSPPKHQKKKSTLLKARTNRNLQTIPENQEWQMTYSNPGHSSHYFILEDFHPQSIFENDSDSEEDDSDSEDDDEEV